MQLVVSTQYLFTTLFYQLDIENNAIDFIEESKGMLVFTPRHGIALTMADVSIKSTPKESIDVSAINFRSIAQHLKNIEDQPVTITIGAGRLKLEFIY